MENNFAEILATLRKRAGLNQEEMAEMLEVSVDTVRRWEGGKQEPRLGELVRIAKILGISVSQLINEENSNSKDMPLIRSYKDFDLKKVSLGKKIGGNIVIQQGNTRVEMPATARGYDILEKKLKDVNLGTDSFIFNDLYVAR